MVTLGANATVGAVGDSLTTGNEGFLGAVPWYGPTYSWLASQFQGSAPAPSSLPGRIALPPGVTAFNRGAPTWAVVGLDSQNIQTIRTFLQSLPISTTHVFFEGGTNDVTNQIAPSTSNTQLVGAMNDAIARFPLLQAFFYVGVTCIGEMYQVVGGVPSFAGNNSVLTGIDATIDSLMATLFASVNAQTGTNSLGQPISFVPLPMRATGVAQLAASGNPPPYQNAGYLTVDGRHPLTGGLPITARTCAQNATTVVAP